MRIDLTLPPPDVVREEALNAPRARWLRWLVETFPACVEDQEPPVSFSTWLLCFSDEAQENP